MPGKVKVKIVAGRNLPVMDRASDNTDAYVEIKLGNTTYKTEVCRKSLNPQWNSEWYRFEVDDSELQDEPLQIRLMDYDTYSANDAIGKVYLDLNPLLLPVIPGPIKNVWTNESTSVPTASTPGGSVMSGWIPVYDTMHGIRGEVNVIVKVEFFSDFNRFRQSSCGVQFFCSRMIPQCYHAQVIHGFVEELVVNDDPEYQWIDKIRTPRASNEARQTLFLKLSGELQRKIGLKALDLGGNAVIGYQQCFDLEGESGIVVRGIGTAVTLVRLQESVPNTHQPVETTIPSDDSGMLPDSVLDVGVAAGMPLVSRCFLPSLSPLLCVTPPTPHDPSPASIPCLGFSPTRVGPNFPGVKVQKFKKSRKRHPVVVIPHYLAVDSTLDIPPAEQRIRREPPKSRISSQPSVDIRQLIGCRKLGRSTQSLRSVASEDLALRNLLLQEDMRGEGRRDSVIVKGLKAIKLLPKPKISKTLSALKVKLQSDITGDEFDECGSLSSVKSPSKYFGRAAELSKAKVKLWKQHSRSSSESVATTLIRSLMDSNNTGLDSVAEVRESPGSSPTSPSRSEAVPGVRVVSRSFRFSAAKREYPSIPKKRPASMSGSASEMEAAFVSRPALNISFSDTYLRFSCKENAPQLQYDDGHLIPNDPLGLSSTSESSSSDDETSEDLSSDVAFKERTPSYRPSPSPSVGYFASDIHTNYKHPTLGTFAESENVGVPQDSESTLDTAFAEVCLLKDSCSTDLVNKATKEKKNMTVKNITVSTDLPAVGVTPNSISVGNKCNSLAITNCVSPNLLNNLQEKTFLATFTMKNNEAATPYTTPNDTYKDNENVIHVNLAGINNSALITSNQERGVPENAVTSRPSNANLPCTSVHAGYDEKRIRNEDLQENVKLPSVKEVEPNFPPTTAVLTCEHCPPPTFTAPSSACLVDVVFDVGGKSPPCRPAADVQKSRSEGSLHGCGGEGNEGDLPLLQHRNAEHGPCFIPASRQAAAPGEDLVPDKLPGSPMTATHSSSVGHKTTPSPAKLGNIASNAIHRRSSDSDLSITPKGNSLTSSDRSSTAGTHLRQTPTVVRPPMNQESLDMLEYPFLTVHKFPPGFILHLGGVVSSRSVKLLERITNLEDPETRDAWWTEIRMEVRSHARALGCNVVLGYCEHTSICDDVCVLSASGTAAVISLDPDGGGGGGGGGANVSVPHPPPWVHAHTRELMTTSLDRPEFADKPDSRNVTPQKAEGPVAVVGAAKAKNSPCDVFECEVMSCTMCHIPYSESSIPFRVNMLKCAICRRGKVPDVLFTTIEPPDGIPTTGVGCLLQAYVCRPKPYCKGELNAKEISDGLPFLEYELHRLLINKLKVKGMNAIFGLKVQVQVGERMMIGLATGTAVFLCPLPAPPVPKISAGNSWTDEKKLTEMQKRLLDTVKKNRDVYQLKPITEVDVQSNGKAAPSDTDDSEDELPELDLAAGNKDTCVLEVDDAEDVDVVSLLMDPAPPDGFHAVNVETVPGLDDLEIVRNLQMFMQVWRAKIQPGQLTSNFSEHFHRVLQAVYFKLRRMVPCALCNLQFSVELPEPDELQLSVLGMALGLGELQAVHSSFYKKLVLQSTGKEPSKKIDDSEMIFKLDDDHPPLSEVVAPAAPLPPQLGRPRPRSPQRVRPLQPVAKLQHMPPRGGRYGVDITPLCYVPGGKIERYLGNLNFFFIRESTGIRECGGLSGFVHSFVTEVLAIVRAHVTALGGNAMVAYFISECILYHSPHKNQGQCLVNVGGDVVHVSYFAEDY